MLDALNTLMEAIESHPWFVLLDLMFHLVIIGHVIHHVVHASHRHLWPRIDRAWTRAVYEVGWFLWVNTPQWAATANVNLRLMALTYWADERMRRTSENTQPVP